MITEELQEVEAFAAKILRKYFCESDIDFLISTFAPDIIWIGGGEMMIAEEAAACFRAGKEDGAGGTERSDRRSVWRTDGAAGI